MLKSRIAGLLCRVCRSVLPLVSSRTARSPSHRNLSSLVRRFQSQDESGKHPQMCLSHLLEGLTYFECVEGPCFLLRDLSDHNGRLKMVLELGIELQRSYCAILREGWRAIVFRHQAVLPCTDLFSNFFFCQRKIMRKDVFTGWCIVRSRSLFIRTKLTSNLRDCVVRFSWTFEIPSSSWFFSILPCRFWTFEIYCFVIVLYGLVTWCSIQRVPLGKALSTTETIKSIGTRKL